jgi:hypothetical protein
VTSHFDVFTILVVTIFFMRFITQDFAGVVEVSFCFLNGIHDL